jgi:hypothetical protein
LTLAVGGDDGRLWVLLLDSIRDDGGATVYWFVRIVGAGLDWSLQLLGVGAAGGRCCWVAGLDVLRVEDGCCLLLMVDACPLVWLRFVGRESVPNRDTADYRKKGLGSN